MSFCKTKGNVTEFEYETADIKLWKGKWIITVWTNVSNSTFDDFVSVIEEVAKHGLIFVLELIVKNTFIYDIFIFKLKGYGLCMPEFKFYICFSALTMLG